MRCGRMPMRARAVPLAAPVLLTWLAGPAWALEFSASDGQVSGRLDTNVTLGTAVRVGKRDPDIIGLANGGRAASVNVDDGNLNFGRGDLTSLAAQVTHDLQLDWRNFGFFGRLFYFYDAAVMAIEPERTKFSRLEKNAAGYDIQVLDAYAVGDFEIKERPLTIRIGNQVLNWGESTFIQNGINVVNPIDVTKLRVAGAEIRDALVPVPVLNASMGLTDALSVEAFYQFDWKQTEIEARGTFFSTNDFISPGGDKVVLGFGAIPDNPPPAGANAPIGPFVPRASDVDPADQGQFGLALRYFSEALNDTEFGLYYILHHSRLPLVSVRTGSLDSFLAGDYASSARYFAEFPENVHLIGASFNTALPIAGLALQGEVSYRIGQPLQVDDVELIFAGLSPLDAFLPTPVFGANQLGTFGFGQAIAGYRREDVIQAQMTATQTLGPMVGADQITLVGEIGATFIPGLPDQDELRFNGPGTFTSGNPLFTQAGIQPVTTTHGFGDDLSWGYRLLIRAQYLGAIGPVNLTPQMAFTHDVSGTTPEPLSNFVEDRKALTLTLGASYLDSLRGEISFTSFFDGGQFNLLTDRDFVSLAISYSF